jgi:hypothetical protein
MKYNGKEEVLFEDDIILEDLACKWFVIKNKFATKEISKAPTDTARVEAFKEHFKVEFDMEEMIEFRHFMDEDYSTWKMDNINVETKNAQIVDLKRLGLE